jgi:hypothetical protein
MSPTQEKVPIRLKSWVRLVLLLGCALVVLIGANVGYQAFTTLKQLDVIEAERDRWQRSSEVIQGAQSKGWRFRRRSWLRFRILLPQTLRSNRSEW